MNNYTTQLHIVATEVLPTLNDMTEDVIEDVA
jgi:hypothetical protein